MLGLPATDPARYAWEPVQPGDQDHMPTGQRLLHVVADRMHWLQALDQARRRAEGLSEDLPGNRGGGVMTVSPWRAAMSLGCSCGAGGSRALAISRSKVYELLAAGVLASVRIDGSRRIPVSALESNISALWLAKRWRDGASGRGYQAR